MEIVLTNVLNTLSSQGLDPRTDTDGRLGMKLGEIIPTWNSWSYDEATDTMTVWFTITVSQRIMEFGEVQEGDFTLW